MEFEPIRDDPGKFLGEDGAIYELRYKDDFREAWNMRLVASAGGWVEQDELAGETLEEKVLSLWDGKTTQAEAAKIAGIGRQRVADIWKKHAKPDTRKNKTSERIGKITELCKAGLSNSKIASVLGVTCEEVSRLAGKAGIKNPANYKEQAKLLIPSILDLIARGKSNTQISRELPVNRRYVEKIRGDLDNFKGYNQ